MGSILLTFLALDPNTGSDVNVKYNLSSFTVAAGGGDSALNANYFSLNTSAGTLTLVSSVLSVVSSSQILNVRFTLSAVMYFRHEL